MYVQNHRNLKNIILLFLSDNYQKKVTYRRRILAFSIILLENTIMDKIIGRKAEIKQILECFESDKSELVSVYGCHRVGKTFLIKRCFNEEFDFWFTGIYKATRVQHLTQFQNVLKEKCGTNIKKLQDWFQAFEALKNYLLSLNKDKVVVFFR